MHSLLYIDLAMSFAISLAMSLARSLAMSLAMSIEMTLESPKVCAGGILKLNEIRARDARDARRRSNGDIIHSKYIHGNACRATAKVITKSI